MNNLSSRYICDTDGQWWYIMTTNPIRRTRAIIDKCLACGTDFLTIPQRRNVLNQKRGRFCSRKCGSKALGGHKNKVGSLSHCWRGGRNVIRGGYIEVFKPEHPYARGGKYVREHRLVMEQMLGRYLEPWEEVHHKNGVRADNRPENLELWIRSHPAGARHNEAAQHCPTCSCSPTIH
jgi:hypothetical protein